jgi:hypothetical protein
LLVATPGSDKVPAIVSEQPEDVPDLHGRKLQRNRLPGKELLDPPAPEAPPGWP